MKTRTRHLDLNITEAAKAMIRAGFTAETIDEVGGCDGWTEELMSNTLAGSRFETAVAQEIKRLTKENQL